mmetsp:Transcript_6043/g.10587  ORF Transcript_6043/g.10587 Transcript_6043/m.10587 type:complete len:463 (+) Transcript_6043:37-1425(+)
MANTNQNEVKPMEEDTGLTTTTQQDFSPELLRIYYSRLFPYTQMFRWLSYGNDPEAKEELAGGERDLFYRREFSFTLEDDIYLRYQAFRTAEEMRAEMMKKQPHKIDIGAVFTVPPPQHATVKPAAFRPASRELVFDIDMNDYDDVRTCCAGAVVCRRCWAFMTCAVKVLDAALREDFGFRHVLFVYSGRRGVHCWVADEGARLLPNEARAAVVDYLSVVAGNENSDRRTNLTWPLHPSLARAYTLLLPYFEETMVDADGQDILGTEERRRKLLATVPHAGLREKFAAAWGGVRGAQTTELEKWESLVAAVDAQAEKERQSRRSSAKRPAPQKNDPVTALKLWKYETVFCHCYPRLDENVSKGMNHLLKSPFAVHPKTGRVCVPIDADTCEDFNPLSVPTLGTLCNQLDNYATPEEVKDFEKTDLKQYIDGFDKDFLGPLYKSIRAKARQEAESMSAIRNDW